MKTTPHPHSVPALPPDPRLAVISRRVSASGSMAGTLADLIFGTPKRDDVAMVAFTSASRVAAYAEARF